MRKRTIYHIEYAKNGEIAASGGEICMLENIKFLVSQGEKNCILTTEKGKQAFLDWGLEESDLLNFVTIDTIDPKSRIKLLFNYIKRVFLARKSIKNINFQDEDIVICHSDFFPNTIPLYQISRKNKNLKLFYFFHVQAPRLFYGFLGEFMNIKHFPSIFFLYYKLNQFLYIQIINCIDKGILIAVNPSYQKYLKKRIHKNITIHFLNIFGGVSGFHTKHNVEKKYDCAWMGRFQHLKGLKEFFDIALHLKEKKSTIKIVVIGGGSQQSEEEFVKNIQKFGLEKNIDYKGFLNGKERFEILSQAKVFLMTSYFEGRPIVILELLRLGIPVVAYNLPVYGVYNKGIEKVEILNNIQFSQKVLEILSNETLYQKHSLEAKEFSKNYSRENTGREIYNLI